MNLTPLGRTRNPPELGAERGSFGQGGCAVGRGPGGDGRLLGPLGFGGGWVRCRGPRAAASLSLSRRFAVVVVCASLSTEVLPGKENLIHRAGGPVPHLQGSGASHLLRLLDEGAELGCPRASAAMLREAPRFGSPSKTSS